MVGCYVVDVVGLGAGGGVGELGGFVVVSVDLLVTVFLPGLPAVKVLQ